MEEFMAQNDKFGYHEVVHLSSIISGLWEDEILEHGAVRENKKLKKAALEINKRLADFYQLSAQISYKNFPI